MTKTQRNHIDLVTLVAVLILMVLSLGVVYSASATWALEKLGASNRLLNLHILKVLLGLVALFAGMMINYNRYKKFTKIALITAIALLGITLLLGGEVKGATRWLRLGVWVSSHRSLQNLRCCFICALSSPPKVI